MEIYETFEENLLKHINKINDELSHDAVIRSMDKEHRELLIRVLEISYEALKELIKLKSCK